MLKDSNKHLVEFCQCSFARYLEKMAEGEPSEDDNNELSSNISDNSNTKEEEQ